MAHQQIGPARRAMPFHRRLQMLKQLEAEPVHAGVEMQRARENAAAPHGEGGPAREFLLAADDRREAALGIVRGFRAALEAVEHGDRRFSRQQATRREPLA